MLKDIVAAKALAEYRLHLRFEDGVEGVGGTADVHDDAVGIEIGLAELDIDDVCGAVELLRRAKY